MALDTYTNLQAAIRTEIKFDTNTIAAAVIVDAINKAESKVNRRSRCVQQQTLATDTLTSASRLVDAPAGLAEIIAIRTKLATAADSTYVLAHYVGAERISDFYGATVDCLRYTQRIQFEFAPAVTADHTIQFDYIKRWDLATDETNWLLTNYPDVYMYGALAELETHVRNDKRVILWRKLFDSAMAELIELDHRGRDDATLDTSEVAAMSGRRTFNVIQGA